MQRLRNIVAFDKEISDADKEIAEAAGITLYTMEEVIFKGKELKKERMHTVTI